MPRDFVHLHLHTHYSILDGVCRIEPLLDRACELGMKQLAITDHGNMYGAIEFYLKTQKQGIKPILGMEAYVAPGSRKDKTPGQYGKTASHITLLARNITGYRNLSTLTTLGYTEGYYYNPRIDKELLREHAEGLVCLSGCLSSELSRHILNNNEAEAETLAREYMDMFGRENFFFEIMNNKGIAEQQPVMRGTVALAKRLDVPIVATSDVHYILPEHSQVQDIMVCINTGKKLADEKRLKFDSTDFYLKSADEMFAAFVGHEEACEQTLAVAERCHVDLGDMMNSYHLPTIEPPPGKTVVEYLEELCVEGLAGRYGKPLPDAVNERFQYEMKVIVEMGFPSYFLMVWDLVNFARSAKIAVGPGRGSAAGSIVAYALGITNIDPLAYGLLFERFLNEGRQEMPDIDIDFDKDRRQEIIDYLVKRHGREHCAQIVTFGCLSAKSAVRDVGRVMEIPLGDVDRISKMIPDMVKAKGGKNSIEVAMQENADLQTVYDKGLDKSELDAEQSRKLLDAAGALDGVVRQTGIHASGVLVSDKPILYYGPLARPKKDGELTTQYEMKMLDQLGLCKIDVLGLETLSLIRNAIENITLSTGEELALETIPRDDAPTFQMLARGDSKGVFQFESSGFRELLTKLRPDRFEDLIAAVAMYRPGPLGAGLVDTYIACKNGRQEPAYLHPLMEPLLAETFGLILYQEQVQALAQQLAHFSLAEGDLMRRAMGKKIPEIMAEYRGKFVQQAHDTIGEKIADEVFTQIDYFAGYGFNKSHSACYGLIAYQTAYLKCHYPKEYMAALLTTNRGDTKKNVGYIEDAKRMGVAVLPPNINQSEAFFTVNGETILFGLSAIKGVGDKAIEGMVAVRKEGGGFNDLYDFCARVDLRLLNKGTVEALIKAGAMDSFEIHRARLVAGLAGALAAGNAEQKDRESGQMGLFGGMEEPARSQLPQVPEWPEREMLEKEKSVLGYYVTSHPLAEFSEVLEQFGSASTGRFAEMDDRSSLVIGGLIAEARQRTDRRNKRYAQLVIEDMEGTVQVMVFSKLYEACKDMLLEDNIIFVKGILDTTRDEPSILADSIIPIEKAEEQLTESAVLSLDAAGLDYASLDAVKQVVAAHGGAVPLYFKVNTHNRRTVTIQAGERFSVRPSAALREAIAELPEATLVFQGKNSGRRSN